MTRKTKHEIYRGPAKRALLVLIFICVSFLAPGCMNDASAKTNSEKVDAMYKKYKLAFPGVPDLSAAELVEKQKKGKVVLVDNRDPGEQTISIIPGAITDKEFVRDLESYKDKTVVVYCTIGSRSGHYTKKLRKQGIDAYNLKGGVLAWAHAGGAFVDSEGKPTKQVHVYGEKWSLLPEGYEPVW